MLRFAAPGVLPATLAQPELLALGPHAPDHRSVVVPAIEVDRALLGQGIAREQRGQAAPTDRAPGILQRLARARVVAGRAGRRPRLGHQLEDGRGHVCQFDRNSDAAASGDATGQAHDQGDPHCLFVDVYTVVQVTVIHQPFTVVSGHDHQRVVGEPEVVERLEETSHLAVREGDLGVVACDRAIDPTRLQRVCAKALYPTPGRIVGVVRVVVVNEEEEGLLARATHEPIDRTPRRVVRSAVKLASDTPALPHRHT